MLLKKRKPTDSILADKKSAVAITLAVMSPVLVTMIVVLLEVGMLYYYSELAQMGLDSGGSLRSVASSVTMIYHEGYNENSPFTGVRNGPFSGAFVSGANAMASTVASVGQSVFYTWEWSPSEINININGLDSYNRLQISTTVTASNFSGGGAFGGVLSFLNGVSIPANAVVQFIDPTLSPQAFYQSVQW